MTINDKIAEAKLELLREKKLSSVLEARSAIERIRLHIGGWFQFMLPKLKIERIYEDFGIWIVEIARCFLGVHEHGKTNTGYLVDKFNRQIGLYGAPWCLAFIQFVYNLYSEWLGIPDMLSYDTGATQRLAKWCIDNDLCVWTWEEVEPGDLIFWQDGAGSPNGHIAVASVNSIEHRLIEAIEGNTSPSDYRNGGEVHANIYSYSSLGTIGQVEHRRFPKCVMANRKLIAMRTAA